MKLFKNNLLTLSLGSKCDAKDKNIHKMEEHPQEKGRSMIEMLGVLAIIGVLSIGGIAGYSKAMFKYRFNKTMDIWNNVIHRTIEIDGKGGSFDGPQDARTYGFIPDCDLNYVNSDGNKGRACPTPLGEFYLLVEHDGSGFSYGRFGIYFLKHQYESCFAFLNSKAYEVLPDEWWARGIYTPSGGGQITISNGNTGFSLSYLSKPNLTNEAITNACEICKNSKYCAIDINY